MNIQVNGPGVRESVTLGTVNDRVDNNNDQNNDDDLLMNMLPRRGKQSHRKSHKMKSNRSSSSSSSSRTAHRESVDAAPNGDEPVAEAVPEDFDLYINPAKCKTPETMTKEADVEYLKTKMGRPGQQRHSRRYADEEEQDDGFDEDSDGFEDGEDDGFEDEYDDDEEFDEDGSADGRPSSRDRDTVAAVPEANPVEIAKQVAFEKAKILFKLKRREKFMGIEIKYDASMSLEQLRTIEMQYKHEADATSTITMMRQIIVYIAGITEAMAKTMKFTGLDLNGFSSHMFLKVKQYDEALFDIYDEYADSMRFNPVWRLVYLYVMDTLSYSSSQAILSNPEMLRALNDNPMLQQMMNGLTMGGGPGVPMMTTPQPNNSPNFPPTTTTPTATTDDDPDPLAEQKELLRLMNDTQPKSATTPADENVGAITITTATTDGRKAKGRARNIVAVDSLVK